MKIVGGKKYVHKSAIIQLSKEDVDKVDKALNKLPDYCNWKYDVIVISNDQIEFVRCSNWDNVFEPVIMDRFVIKNNNVSFRKESNENPLIYHKRHLFVLPTYKGFNYQNDVKRGEIIDSLGLDKKAIGHFKQWAYIVNRNNLGFFDETGKSKRRRRY